MPEIDFYLLYSYDDGEPIRTIYAYKPGKGLLFHDDSASEWCNSCMSIHEFLDSWKIGYNIEPVDFSLLENIEEPFK